MTLPKALSSLPGKLPEIFGEFYLYYKEALKQNGEPEDKAEAVVSTLIPHILDCLKNPYSFGIYHKRVTEPFDFYRFGLELIRPIITWNDSKLVGREHLRQAASYLEKGDNVVFLSNHQIEPDPQVILLFLEKEFPTIARKLIFVAGHKVTTDPLSVPLSKGLDLLCIHSKKYIDNPPELKAEKTSHNHKAMKKLGELFNEGSKAIYVAPSGGRDRPNDQGMIVPAPFDPQSIEMFSFIAEHCKKRVHFFPLALSTYKLFPPPAQAVKEVGEKRLVFAAPVAVSVGREIDMHSFAGDTCTDRKLRREAKTAHIFGIVLDLYNELGRLQS